MLSDSQQSAIKFHLGYHHGIPAQDFASLYRAFSLVADEYTTEKIGILIDRCESAFDDLALGGGSLIPTAELDVGGDTTRTTSLTERDPYPRRVRAYNNECNYLARSLGVRNFRDPEQAFQSYLVDGAMFINSIPGAPGQDGTGDMEKLIYDPTDISANCFDLAYHFGYLDGGVFT
jgi:hypothetical protein